MWDGVEYTHMNVVQSTETGQQKTLARLEDEGPWLQRLLRQSQIELLGSQQVDELSKIKEHYSYTLHCLLVPA